MSLAVLANHMASKGRNGDTMLVHMAPSEVAGLQALGLRHGVSMTINPHTGLPEAFSFKSLLKSALPMIAGFALGPAGFGLVSSALGAGALVGGATALATGSLQKGIMAGLGAYGGASLGMGLDTAGAAAAQSAAMTPEAIAQITGPELVGNASAEAIARNQLAEQASREYMSKGLFDRMGAGISALGTEAGRSAALQGVGGTSGLIKAGMAAAMPIMADQAVQTKTPMPGGSQYTGTIRPYTFDPYTKQWTAQPTYPATPVKTEAEGMNSGGIVALADGGFTDERVAQALKESMDQGFSLDQSLSGAANKFGVSQDQLARAQGLMNPAASPAGATREDVLSAYRANPLAEMNPGEEAINYWMSKGLGGFNQAVQDVRASNPALAAQIDAARQAAAVPQGGIVTPTTPMQFANDATRLPMYLGLNAVAAANAPSAIISKEALSAYDYSAAKPKDTTEEAINSIYNRVLGRQAEQKGLDYWSNAVKEGTLTLADVERRIREIGQNIGVVVDPTQLATPTAAQLTAQRSILNDPQAAALDLVQRGLDKGRTAQQIADIANLQYGKNFTAQDVASFIAANNLKANVKLPAVIPPLVPGTTPGIVSTGEPFTPTAPTMGEVRKEYEQGGGSTTMPTITDIKPTDRTYTQNQAFALLQGYLKNNPNAQYQDVLSFAASRGIPAMQARAAYNEFRFSNMTGGTQQAYDYLMGRGAYPVSPFVPGGGPIMRPYRDIVGGTGQESAIRRYVPPEPERRTALGTTDTAVNTRATGTTAGIAGLTGGTALLPGTSTITGATATGPSGGTVVSGDARSADLVATNPNFVDTTQAATVANTLADNTGIDPMDALMIVTNAFGTAKNTSDVLGNAATALADNTGMDPMDALMYVTNAFGTGPGVHTGDTEGSITGGLIPALVDRPVGETLAPVEDRSIPYNPTFDYGGYGGGGGKQFLDLAGEEKEFKRGGLMDIAAAAAARGGDVPRFNLGSYSDGGRLLRGPGDGVSDSIPATIGNKQPARLADGEFVVPARIVSEIGNGSTEAGARKLYAMMDRVQRARAKTTGKGRVAKDTKAEKYLPA